MGLKIVIPAGYQRVKKISLTAMPKRGVHIVLAPLQGDWGAK
jgi:hypothetical protein